MNVKHEKSVIQLNKNSIFFFFYLDWQQLQRLIIANGEVAEIGPFHTFGGSINAYILPFYETFWPTFH